jgi:triosephosphate isomerase
MTTTTVPMMGRSLRVSASEGSSAGIAAQTQLAAHQVLPDWDSLPVSQGFGWSPMLLILLATAAAAVATFVWSVVKHNNHQEYIALAPHSSESLERRRKLLEKEAEYRRSMGHPGPDQVSAPTSAIPGLRKPVVGGNWKCNPESMADLDGLIANINACDTSKCDLYVCPSPLHVAYCCDKIRNGALITPQNCNFKGCGAFTGEMAVEQMKAMGITQVLIGHSERRGEFGIFPMDNNDTLAIKLKYILDAGMKCVFCIGESKEIRERGLDAVLHEMDVQLRQIYHLLDPAKVVIAYEPVWAIGTGLTATPEDAQATHAGIRQLIAKRASPRVAQAMRIQYGGSANAQNAHALSVMPDIDGFLVGGASLKPEFADIVSAISAAK